MKHPLLPDRSLVAGLAVSAATVRRDARPVDMTKFGRWYYSAKGALWRLAKAEERRAYQRAWYAANREHRRAYLNAKQRERREREQRA